MKLSSASLTIVLACAGTPLSQARPPVPGRVDLNAAPGLQEPSEAIDQELSRALPRILYLEGGRVVRARARRAGDAWTWKTQGIEGRILVSQVERVALEKEVLAQADVLRRELDATQGEPSLLRRVAYASWLAGAGLIPESLEELDRVLADDPEDARARALFDRELAALRLPFDTRSGGPEGSPGSEDALELERARLALISQGRLGTPSMRELVVRALAEDPDPGALAAELERSLHDVSAKRRSFAAFATSRLFPGAQPQTFVVRAMFDHDADVRREMTRALARQQELELDAEGSFLRALESPLSSIRKHAAEGLAILGTDRAIKPLLNNLASIASGAAQSGGAQRPPRSHIFLGSQIAYVMDYDVEIAQGASIADPVIGVIQDGSLLDVAGYGVTIQREIAYEARAVRRALEHVTGEHPGDTNQAWLRWREQREQRED